MKRRYLWTLIILITVSISVFVYYILRDLKSPYQKIDIYKFKYFDPSNKTNTPLLSITDKRTMNKIARILENATELKNIMSSVTIPDYILEVHNTDNSIQLLYLHLLKNAPQGMYYCNWKRGTYSVSRSDTKKLKKIINESSEQSSRTVIKLLDKDMINQDPKETVIIKNCNVENGPGENYQCIGSLNDDDTVNLIGSYNGWYLAENDELGEFWVKGENVIDYNFNYEEWEFGIITAEKVKVGQATLVKGNLVWILKKDRRPKSYVRLPSAETSSGYSGWINKSDFTTDKNGVYFNQAFLRKGAKVYTEPSEKSELSTDFTDFYGDWINIDRFGEDDWMYVSAGGGRSGWVENTEIYIPSRSNKIQTYSDKRFNFSVEFPRNWVSEVTETQNTPVTKDRSASGGINVYVKGNTNDIISVIGHCEYFGIPLSGFVDADYDTNSGIEGTLYYRIINKRYEMYLLLNNGSSYYVHVNVSSDCFDKNESEIMDILKSIDIVFN